MDWLELKDVELDSEVMEWCKVIHDIWQVNINISCASFIGYREYNITCWRKLECFAIGRMEATVLLSEAQFNDKKKLMVAISDKAEECQLSTYQYALTKVTEFPSIGGD